MQGRKKHMIDDDYEPVRKKHFFDRHPGLKWALLGLMVGLVVAAVALPLIITLGTGIGPFVAIGAAFGLTDTLIAGTVGLAVVTGAAMTAFSAVLGSIAAIGNRFRKPRAKDDELSVSATNVSPMPTNVAPTADQIAMQQANLRNSTTAGSLFKEKPQEDKVADVAEEQRLVV